MKRNDCDDFLDTVIIGSSALYPLAKGAIQMLILLFFYYYYVLIHHADTVYKDIL